MASSKDVTQRANVSLMTVSRAIDGPERLRPEAYKKVMEAVDALGYASDLPAKKIRGAKTTVNTIGVLVLDTMTTPFSAEITLSIEETARACGWNSFVVNISSNDKSEKMVNLPLAYRPGGVTYTAVGLRRVPVPEKLYEYRCVLVNCESTSGSFPTHIPDDEQGQYLDAKALLVIGYRQLLCIHLPREIVATDRRRAGTERTCREAGADPDTMFHHYLPPEERHHIDTAEIARHYLNDARSMFDAVVCGNDHVVFTIHQVLLGRGLRIPQDVAVLGYDNMVGAGELFLPPLPTVQLPHYEIGRLSALYLIRGLDHRGIVRVDSPWPPRASI